MPPAPHKAAPLIATCHLSPCQLYFEKVTEIVVLGRQGGGEVLSHALSSLASDAGLHPLLPYLTHFVKEEVGRGMGVGGGDGKGWF